MSTRRQFMLKLLWLLAGSGASSQIFSGAPPAAAGMAPKTILPKGTDPRSLANRNPQDLDARHLEVMPLDDFKTMGLSEHRVDSDAWRLRVTGKVQTPLALTYAETRGLPAIEKNVLLICPGVFCNHGRWRGVSLRNLLDLSGAGPGATHVTVRGPTGPYQKTHRLELSDIAADRAFLAYDVNGQKLPARHGFPLRLVSESDYGFDWIKYVDRIEIEEITGTP